MHIGWFDAVTISARRTIPPTVSNCRRCAATKAFTTCIELVMLGNEGVHESLLDKLRTTI